MELRVESPAHQEASDKLGLKEPLTILAFRTSSDRDDLHAAQNGKYAIAAIEGIQNELRNAMKHNLSEEWADDDDLVTVGGGYTSTAPKTFVPKDDVAAFRDGVEWCRQVIYEAVDRWGLNE